MYIITWNKILQGWIDESIYDTNTMKKIYEKCLEINDSSCISNNIGFHKMSNNYNQICINIHIYSPPKYKTNYYW